MQKTTTPDLTESCVLAADHKELAAHGVWRIGYTVVKKAHHRISNERDLRFGHIHVCLSGSPEVMVAGRWCKLEPKKAYVCPPGESWQWRFDDSSKPWRVLFVRLLSGDGRMVNYAAPHPYVTEAHTEDLLWVFRRLSIESHYLARPVVLRCLAELIQFHCRELISSDVVDGGLSDLWLEVMGNLSYDWTLNRMVKRSGMGKESLRKKCIKETGRSPVKQLAYLRMQHACHLLIDQDMSLDEIAQAIGYETSFSFSKAFLAHAGMRPSAYRKQYG